MCLHRCLQLEVGCRLRRIVLDLTRALSCCRVTLIGAADTGMQLTRRFMAPNSTVEEAAWDEEWWQRNRLDRTRVAEARVLRRRTRYSVSYMRASFSSPPLS